MAVKKPKISDSSSQQTNQQMDSQVLIDMLLLTLGQDIKQNIQDEINKIQPEINSKIDDLVKEAKENVVSEITSSRKELQTVKNSVLGAIALFAAFFTFVSVNINIFSHSTALESIALMIVMWVCLMGFAYVFFLFLWDSWQNLKCWYPVIVGMMISCALLFLVKTECTKNFTKDVTQPKIEKAQQAGQPDGGEQRSTK